MDDTPPGQASAAPPHQPESFRARWPRHRALSCNPFVIPGLAQIHQALVEDYRESFGIAAAKLVAKPSWSLEATVVLMHLHNGEVTIGPVGSLPLWLEHLPPELDAFVRLQQQGVTFEEAYAQCLVEQGQEFTGACETAKRNKPLVTHDNLAELTALSQKGFAREPRELLALAQWSDHVSGFLLSCEPLR